MPLEVHRRQIDGITILDLTGRIVLGSEATEARAIFTQAADSVEKKIIVNLQNVDYIDSTGLGTLVIGHSAIQEAGGVMKLLHLSKRHIELMVVSKLTAIFEIFDDEQSAINSFYPDREVKRFDILEFVRSQEGSEEKLGANPEKTEESE